MPPTDRVFLSAEWRDLVILNYEVDPLLLTKYVPPGTALDSFEGKTYISLVGFRFSRTRLFGSVGIPLHSNFYEVNLRFYVSRRKGGEIRRGVVFIAEIVPRQAIATIARVVYGEKYVCLPMKHRVLDKDGGRRVEYEWQLNGQQCKLAAQSSSLPALPIQGSLEQFITEHYWGYSIQRGGGSFEYYVSHVPWRVWQSTASSFEGDTALLYGHELGDVLRNGPSSAFIAEGSPVLVFKGREIL